MSNRWATSVNSVISTLKSLIIVNETMDADSSEDCTIGESPMFRCNQEGETPKVTQIVKSVEFCRFQWQKYKLLHGMKGSNPICTGNW
jgi:hypothetical protein